MPAIAQEPFGDDVQEKSVWHFAGIWDLRLPPRRRRVVAPNVGRRQCGLLQCSETGNDECEGQTAQP